MPLSNNLSVKKKIWAIGGGKGGTGKSLISATLAIELARMGKEVILVDADLGGANLHTCLGIKQPSITLADFINKRVKDLKDVLIDTPVKRLRLISSASDLLNIVNPQYQQKLRLIKNIKLLPVEYIIIDIGAGTSFNVLDFFLISNSGILVVSPEPTSIENVYRFLKNSILRKLRFSITPTDIRKKIKRVLDENTDGEFRTIYELIDLVSKEDNKSAEWFIKQLENFKPALILNQVRNKEEVFLGKAIKDITKKYLGININYVGYVPYDERVYESIKKYKSFITEFPHCPAAMNISLATKKLIELSEN